MPYKDPEKRREQQRRFYAANPDYQKQQYRKHRQKRLEAKKATYDPDTTREKNRAYYAANQARLVEYAREYRKANAATINKKSAERYHAFKDVINERRKGYRAKNYAKIYAAIQGWRKRNPEKEMFYAAKRLICDQVGVPFKEIPDDLVEAKMLQLEISRWVRQQKAKEQAP